MSARSNGWILLLALSVVLTGAGACTHGTQRVPRVAKPATSPAAQVAAPAPERKLEPKAIDLLKAASSRLAAARSMRFTAVVSYENPSVFGPPLSYATKSSVAVQRPDKLRVITSADGPASEFYYDGTKMTAFAPAENVVAVTEAPNTIDGALQTAYDSAAIYFPFSDLVVADPYGDIADGLKLAFYIGQSHVVGGTTTDMVAYASDDVFVQIWIGADDKLPRMLRAVYTHDPAQLRHQMELSDWRLNPAIAADAFRSSKASHAKPIQFAHPGSKLPEEARRPGKAVPSGTQ